MGLSLLIVDASAEINNFIARRIHEESPLVLIAVVESGKDCLEYIRSHHLYCILSITSGVKYGWRT